MRIIILIFLLFYLSCSYANARDGRFYSFETGFDIDLLPQIFDKADSLANTLVQNTQHYFIFHTQAERTFIIYDGMNYVFEWENGQINNISNEEFHGFNFTSFKFEREGKIYTYGGAGFWTFSSDIKFFNEELGKWEAIPVEGEKPYFDGGRQLFSFYSNDKLYAYFHSYSPFDRYRYPITIEENRLYIYDFKSSKWSASNFFDEIIPLRRLTSIETRNFFNFYHEGYLSFLIDKEELTYYSFPRDFKGFGFFKDDFFKFNNVAIIGDSVVVLDKPPHSSILEIFDFDQAKQRLNIEPFRVKTLNSKNSNFGTIIFGGIFFILLLWWLIINYKYIHLIRHFPYPKLLAEIQNDINQTVLDECLSINKNQVKIGLKSKRSEIIQEINYSYNRIIEISRIRAIDDKRVFQYRIELKINKLSSWYLLKFIIPKVMSSR